MNDTPKRWLIEDSESERYIMDGYADPLEAAMAWARKNHASDQTVRVSEILKGHEVDLRSSVKADYR